MKLPTDNVVMPPEERENFLMLFPDDNSIQNNNITMPQSSVNTNTTLEQTSSSVQKRQNINTQKLKKEVMSLTLFIAVFFILNLPYVKNLIVEYIPMCHKSWIATHLVQAIIFAFILWIVVNSEYSRI